MELGFCLCQYLCVDFLETLHVHHQRSCCLKVHRIYYQWHIFSSFCVLYLIQLEWSLPSEVKLTTKFQILAARENYWCILIRIQTLLLSTLAKSLLANVPNDVLALQLFLVKKRLTNNERED